MVKLRAALLLALVAVSQIVNAWPFGGSQPEKLGPIPIDQTYDSKIMTVHSARSPFYLVRGAIPFWSFGGATVVSDEAVKLTPAIQSKVGWMWNQKPVTVDEWEVEMKVKIWGNTGLGADGMAFWYISQPFVNKEGPTFGGPQSWNGLAVVFDTFDNDNTGDNPKISVLYNDESWNYDPSSEGKEHQLGSCRSYYRNQETSVKIQYFAGNIQVWVKTANKQDYEFCTRAAVNLPSRSYLGVTAATGGVVDNHDLINFQFNRLVGGPEPVRDEEKVPSRPNRMKGAPPLEEIQVEDTPEEPEPVQEDGEDADEPNQERVDSLVEKLKELKSELNEDKPTKTPKGKTPKGKTPKTKTPPPPPPPPPPPKEEEEEVLEEDSPEADEIHKIIESQNELRENFLAIKSSVDTFSNRAHEYAQQLEKISKTQNQIADILQKIIDGGGMGGGDSGAVGSELRELRDILNSKISPAAETHTRQLEGISRLVNELRGKVEETKNTQKTMHNSMQRNQEELSNSLGNNSSFGFWTYFLLFQCMFGVAFMWFRKYQADKEKKLF